MELELHHDEGFHNLLELPPSSFNISKFLNFLNYLPFLSIIFLYILYSTPRILFDPELSIIELSQPFYISTAAISLSVTSTSSSRGAKATPP